MALVHYMTLLDSFFLQEQLIAHEIILTKKILKI